MKRMLIIIVGLFTLITGCTVKSQSTFSSTPETSCLEDTIETGTSDTPSAQDKTLGSVKITPVINNKYVVTNVVENPEREVIFKYRGLKHDFWVVRLGTVENVPISYEKADYYDGIKSREIEITRKKITETTVKKASEECLMATTRTVSSSDAKFNAGLKIPIAELFKIDLAGFESKLSNSKCEELARITRITYETVVTESETLEISKKYTIGEPSDLKGYYRMCLLANCDVIAYIVKDRTTGDYSYDLDISALDGSFYEALEYSETNTFSVNDPATVLELDLSTFDRLP